MVATVGISTRCSERRVVVTVPVQHCVNKSELILTQNQTEKFKGKFVAYKMEELFHKSPDIKNPDKFCYGYLSQRQFLFNNNKEDEGYRLSRLRHNEPDKVLPREPAKDFILTQAFIEKNTLSMRKITLEEWGIIIFKLKENKLTVNSYHRDETKNIAKQMDDGNPLTLNIIKSVCLGEYSEWLLEKPEWREIWGCIKKQHPSVSKTFMFGNGGILYYRGLLELPCILDHI
jgi:hypothetical protein